MLQEVRRSSWAARDDARHATSARNSSGWAAALRAGVGSPPASAGAFLPGSQWQLADAAQAYRHPPAAVDPRQPQVVTFEPDLSAPAWPAGGWLLLAVVHAEDDPLSESSGDIRLLVRTSRHTAARSVRRFVP